MIGPQVRLAYPLPGATGVATGAATLLYLAPASQFVSLAPASPAPSGRIPLAVAALPAVLPSPRATPAAGERYFAASYPALASGTVYGLEGLTSEVTCGTTIGPPIEAGTGSFETGEN